MRKLVLVSAIPLALLAAGAVPLSAQAPAPRPAAALDLGDRFAEPASRGLFSQTTFPGRLVTAVGGAAIGAGIGFFASQVVQGDWDDGERLDRPAWAAVGGSIGFAVGFTFPVGGRGAPPDPARALPRGRMALTADELNRTGVKTAAEAVESLRPEWLRGRGVHIIGESSDQTIQVYLDDVHLGGLRFLADVPANAIRSIHFFDAAAATLRWGAGHSHGVILVIAAGGLPGGLR